MLCRLLDTARSASEESFEGNCVHMNKAHVDPAHLVVVVKLKGLHNLPYHEVKKILLRIY